MIDFTKAIQAGTPPSSDELLAATKYCIQQSSTQRLFVFVTGFCSLVILGCLVAVSFPKPQMILLGLMGLFGLMMTFGMLGLMFRWQAMADAYFLSMPAENGPEMLVAVGQVPTGDTYCDGILQAGREFRLGEYQAMTQLAKKAREQAAMKKLGCAGGCACR